MHIYVNFSEINAYLCEFIHNICMFMIILLIFGEIHEYSESANVRLATVQEIAGSLGLATPYDIHPDGDRMLVRVMGDVERDGNEFQGFVVTQNWFTDILFYFY